MPGANLQSGTEGPHQSEGSSRIPDVIDLTAEDISLPTDPSFGPSIGFQPIESNEEENLSYATIGPFRQIIS